MASAHRAKTYTKADVLAIARRAKRGEVVTVGELRALALFVQGETGDQH